MDIKGNIHIILNKCKGGKWVQGNSGWARGHAFINDRLLTGSSLIDFCESVIRKHSSKDCLAELNGFFIVIVWVEDAIYIISDKMRTFPLFYYQENGVFFVYDNPDELLKNKANVKIKKENVDYFLACGYLSGSETLVEGCSVVSPASIVSFDKGRINEEIYSSRTFTKSNASKDYQEICFDITTRMAKRLKEISSGREIVIPLSGGYDSRFIVCICKMFGISNVKCYTYGIKGSFEASVAMEVAEKLKIPIYFIESSEDKWKEIFQKDIVKEYLIYGGNIDSVAHLQDFFAVYELKKCGMVSENAIFVPGHSGDMLAGSHFLPYITKNNLVKSVYDKYFIINVLNKKDEGKLKNILKSELCVNGINTQEECYEAIYRWNIKCRQPNYIINSVRAYEFFGYSWWLPLWDDEFVRFWSSIYCCQRKDARLYDSFIFDKFFIPLGVDKRKNELEFSFFGRMARRFLTFGDKYRIKLLLNKMHMYQFDVDNSMLCKVVDFITSYGKYSNADLLPCVYDSMSAKSLFYLYYIEDLIKNK